MSLGRVEYCINPKTKRKIQIGGRTWKRLIKQGRIERNGYEPENVLYTIDESKYDNPVEAKKKLYDQKIKLHNQDKDLNKHLVVKGNKIYRAEKKITNEEQARLTAGSAISVIDDIQNNVVDIPANMNREEAHQYLQGLIFNKMLEQKKKFKNTKLEPKAKKKVSVIPHKLHSTASSRHNNIKNSSSRKSKPKPLKLVRKRKKKRKKRKIYYSHESAEKDSSNNSSDDKSESNSEPASDSDNSASEIEYIEVYNN